MRHTLIAILFGLVSAWPLRALPCGGGFGHGLAIDPSQKIVIVYRDGIETYVFSPHFCGQAAEFGLILPVPNKLAGSPSLANAAHVIVQETRCGTILPSDRAGAQGTTNGGGEGVQVVNRGQVGMFDWALLKADSAAAFTDWLDTAQYPYDQGALKQFQYYVSKGWYFVAFRVTADSKAPPAGSTLCGDLGPIELSFPSTSPVIPARIAAVGDSSHWQFGWRVFTLAARQQRSTVSGINSTLLFSGSIDDLTAYPALGKLARTGDRLTKLDLTFWGGDLESDISLDADPNQTDFRQTITQTNWVACDDKGCTMGGAAAAWSLLVTGLGLLGLALAARLRRR